ncbi:MAG: alanyl-tRNA editing protein [Desulfobacula sp.]|jgi:Ser-tRNA(Ala) deacylase AlaX
MTKKLFWEDPYRTSLDTVVERVEGSSVFLRETIFYALSGGQESDGGTIGGYPVLEAEKTGPDIAYVLPESHTLKPGDPVRVQIDWDRRYRLMRLHFAAELILELSYQTLTSIEKIGAHISRDKARIDFFWPENIASHFPALILKANELISQNLAVISAFSDELNEKRYWEIPGFARVSCGGTHIKHTGEIERIELKRKNIGKGKERIEIFCT